MHALRLGLQGIEYLSEHRLTLPVPEPALSTLRAVRCGDVDKQGAIELIEDTERLLLAAIESCDLQADYDRINRFLVQEHHYLWSGA